MRRRVFAFDMDRADPATEKDLATGDGHQIHYRTVRSSTCDRTGAARIGIR